MCSSWKTLFISIAVAFLFPGVLPAQSIDLAGTFRVVIRDSNQRPKANVRVTLGKPNAYTLRAVMRGNTSADGILSFGKVPPGQYTLQFIDPEGETNLLETNVLPKGGQTELSYTWPYIHWIAMRYISGTLMDGPVPLNHRSLVLRSFPDERVIASAQTDLQGAFDLPVQSAGRYVLDISRIGENGVPETLGRIYAVVSLQGERQPDLIFVEQTPRGLQYDRICSLGTYDLNDACFEMDDSDGKPLAGALLSFHSEVGFSAVQKHTSDSQGLVKIPTLPAGKYLVQGFAAGETPIRFTAKLNGSTAACKAPMKIAFNPIGAGCAPATPGKAN